MSLTRAAEADLEQRLAVIASRSPETAQRLIDLFEKALLRLHEHPHSCGSAYENPSFADEIRHLLFGFNRKRRYRALFTIRGDEVVILAIRAPGEKPIRPDDLAS